MAMSLRSSSFDDGGVIPSKHTCEGADASPALTWSGVPASAKSLALIVDDPDAPDPKAPKMTYVHWVLYGLPPSLTGLPEAATGGDLPAGAKQGVNDFKRAAWGGPCPPIGRHRYVFKLYALDVAPPDLGNAGKPALEAAMKGHILAEARLVGTYQKGDP